MVATKYTLRGCLEDLIQELSRAYQQSQNVSSQTDPDRSGERMFAMLTFLLGGVACLIAWGSNADFTLADATYLTLNLGLYALLCRLLRSRGVLLSLLSLGITWVLVRCASLWEFPSPMVWTAASVALLGLANVAPHFYVGDVPRGAVDNGKLEMTLTSLQALAAHMAPTSFLEVELDLRCPHKRVFLTSETWSGGFMAYLGMMGGRWKFSQPWLEIKLDGQSRLSARREVTAEKLTETDFEAWTESGLDVLEVRLPGLAKLEIERSLREIRTQNFFERQVLTRSSDPWASDTLTAHLETWKQTGASNPGAKLEVVQDRSRLRPGIPGKFGSTQRVLFYGALGLFLWGLFELARRFL